MKPRELDLIIATALAMVNSGTRRRRLKRHVRVRPRGLVLKPKLALVPKENVAPPAASREQQLVLQHLGLVRSLARSYARRLPASVDRAELESAGTLGLIDAARKYNPTRGAAFPTYAAFRVRGAIVDHMRAAGQYSRTEHRRLENGNDIGPRVEFDSRLVEASECRTSTEGGDPFLVARVRRALTQLPRREALLIVRRFWHGDQQVECCPRLGVNPSRISQLEARALGRLRELLADLRTAS